MLHIYGVCCVPFLFGNPFVKSAFFKSLPKKRSDCESQKTGFGSDLKNPPRVRILWIHDPFLVSPPENAKSVFGFGNPDLHFPNQSDRFSSYFQVGKCLGFRLADSKTRNVLFVNSWCLMGCGAGGGVRRLTAVCCVGAFFFSKQ